MAYEKNFKVIVDSPWGHQTANRMADNSAELRLKMFEQHGDAEMFVGHATMPAIGFDSWGRHSLSEIPKTIARATTALLTGGTLGIGVSWSGIGVPGIVRISAGKYIVPVVGLSTFWATSLLIAGSTVTMLHTVRPYSATSTNGGGNGLWISTYKLDSGAFIAFDASFSLSVYGEV